MTQEVSSIDAYGNLTEKYISQSGSVNSVSSKKYSYDYDHGTLASSVITSINEDDKSYNKESKTYVAAKLSKDDNKFSAIEKTSETESIIEINNADQNTVNHNINNTQKDISINNDGTYIINKTTTINDFKLTGTIKGENVNASTWSKYTSDKDGNKSELVETTFNGASESHSVNEYSNGRKTVTDSAKGNKSTIVYYSSGKIESALIIDGETGMYVTQNKKGERTAYNKYGDLIADESGRSILDWGSLIIQGAKDAYDEGLYWSNADGLQKALYTVAAISFDAAIALEAGAFALSYHHIPILLMSEYADPEATIAEFNNYSRMSALGKFLLTAIGSGIGYISTGISFTVSDQLQIKKDNIQKANELLEKIENQDK